MQIDINYYNTVFCLHIISVVLYFVTRVHTARGY